VEIKTIEEKVINAVRLCMIDKKVKKDIYLTSNLRDDLEFDSMDTLMLVSELEASFNIEIDESRFADIVIVSDIVERLKEVV